MSPRDGDEFTIEELYAFAADNARITAINTDLKAEVVALTERSLNAEALRESMRADLAALKAREAKGCQVYDGIVAGLRTQVAALTKERDEARAQAQQGVPSRVRYRRMVKKAWVYRRAWRAARKHKEAAQREVACVRGNVFSEVAALTKERDEARAAVTYAVDSEREACRELWQGIVANAVSDATAALAKQLEDAKENTGRMERGRARSDDTTERLAEFSARADGRGGLWAPQCDADCAWSDGDLEDSSPLVGGVHFPARDIENADCPACLRLAVEDATKRAEGLEESLRNALASVGDMHNQREAAFAEAESATKRAEGLEADMQRAMDACVTCAGSKHPCPACSELRQALSVAMRGIK